MFSDGTTHSQDTEAPRSLFYWPPFWFFVLLVLAVSGIGYATFQQYKADTRQKEMALLATLADLKVKEITKWIEERKGDAEALTQGSFFSREVEKWLQRGMPSGEIRSMILARMESVRHAYGYRELLLLDARGKLVLSTSPDVHPPDSDSVAQIKEAIRTRSIIFLNIGSRGEFGDMGAAAALLAIHDGKPEAVGAIYLRIEPYGSLFPLMKASPLDHKSLELVLARREGDDVLLLNVPAANEGAGLMRQPLSQPKLPAAMAILGSQALADGVDYRGVPVFAAMRKIPDSNWFFVVKVEQEEIYAPLRRQAWLMAGAIAVLVTLTGMAVGLWWRNQRARILIAEQQQTEAAVRQLNTELEQRVAQRTAQLEAANKELEEFSYSMSHDMRTPLRALDGFSKLLLEEHSANLDDEGKRLLKILRDNAQRMGRLVDDILHFLSMGRRKMEYSSVDIAKLASEIFTALQAAVPARRLRLIIGALPPVWGDRDMIREALHKLLSNAIKFSPADGEALIEIGGAADEEENVYSVTDHGIGFDMRYANKLFRVFERVHPTGQYEGSGIGLALVKRIVTRHGGRVWAEGKPDEGATIYFALPTKEEKHG